VFGLGVLVRQSWAAVELLVLSRVGTAYFFGLGVVAFLWPWLPWSTVKTTAIPMALMMFLLIAPSGIPFLLMALKIQRLFNGVEPTTVSNTVLA
jgi:hypothetical protein